jgi:hypothetical protein
MAMNELKQNIEEGISDGYHTMDELYYYRMLYNAMWVNDMDPILQKAYHIQKSKRHSTGEPCFDGDYFIVQAVLPLDEGENADGFQMTIEEYFLPSGAKVHKEGLTPDIESEMPEELKNAYFALGDLADPQLKDAWNAAKDLIKE